MKKITFILLIILSMSIAGCGNKDEKISFNEVLQNINNQRKEKYENPDISKYLYRNAYNDEGFSDKEINQLINFDAQEAYEKFDKSKVLTLKQAQGDVKCLFKLFKYAYGGYGYFGGDSTFPKAEDKILNELKNKQNIKARDVETLLIDNLSFLKDGHFTINGFHIINKYMKSYYYNDDIEILKDNKGFFTSIKDEKYYLESINNDKNISKYLKLSINESGDLCYNIGILQNAYEAISKLDLDLIKNHNKITKIMELKKSYTYEAKNSKGFEKEIIDNIPVVKCRRMYDIDTGDNTTKMFGESSKELKDKKVFIIDIRGNGGGSDESSMKWFQNYTGKEANSQYVVAKLYSKPACYLYKKSYESQKDKDREYKGKLEYINNNINSKIYNKWEVCDSSAEWVNNKNIIFVLIDKNVASSGESFVDYLRNLENVVFVGTNTVGCDLIPENDCFKLPNSNIVAYFGKGLILHGDNKFLEGEGFYPDIWVDSNDSLDKVIRMCKKYNLDK